MSTDGPLATALPTAQEADATEPRTRADRRGGLRFLGRRLGFYLFTAWAAITLNFLIPRFMPGDPAAALFTAIQTQTGSAPTDAQRAAIEIYYGSPTADLLPRYFEYWKNLAHLDFGVSSSNFPTPVSTLVASALPWTLLLVGVTTILGWIIGTVLGAYMGAKPGGRLDVIFSPLSTFFSALPPFWLALVVLYVFSFKLGWFPPSGGYDPSVPFSLNNVFFLLSVLKYGALPAFTLIFIGFNGWLFSMRNVMVSTINEDYVWLARAKGLSSRRVLWRYSARNALLPNVTGLALAIGGVLGGVLLAEIVFTYPGLGYVLFNALQTHDFPVMQTIFLMITLTVLIANFLADSLYVLLDPRTREAG